MITAQSMTAMIVAAITKDTAWVAAASAGMGFVAGYGIKLLDKD